MCHSNQERLQQQVQFLRRQFLQDGDLPFTNVLTEEVLAQALTAVTGWLDRIFSPLVTLGVFLGQVLGADHSGRAAVAHLIAHRLAPGQRPCARRWASRRATAARQEWSAPRTCPRKTQSVTSGGKMRSSQPRIALSAWAMTSSVRTSVNGNSPSCRNWRRRKRTCSRNAARLECGIRGASLRGMERLATSMLAGEAPLAYLVSPLCLTKIYATFV